MIGSVKLHLHGQFCLPLTSVSVEFELVPIFLVSDADIEATANQRWTSEGPLANPHFACILSI